VPECDGEGRFDFIPSRILMSAALQLDLSQAQGVGMNFREIRRDDPILWRHPMLSDETSSSREWFMQGRQTPGMFCFLNVAYNITSQLLYIVPGAVRAGAQAASTFNPVVIQGYVGLRPRHELLEAIPRHETTPTSAQASSLITRQPHATSKDPSQNIAPKRQNTRIKSKEYVDDSPDDARDEGSLAVETDERGRSGMRIDKGKGKRKDRSEESRESGRKMVVKREPTDLDVEMDELANDQSSPSSPSPPSQKPKKSSMKPGTTKSQLLNEGNSEACERCLKRGTACVYGGHVACDACRAHKQKCTGVREDWRKAKKPAAKKEGVKQAKRAPVTPQATTPQPGEVHVQEASSNATLRRSSRARSTSIPPEVKRTSSTPRRRATPKPQAGPKRGTTPKPAGQTQITPIPKAKSSTRSRSKSKSRKAVEDEDMSDGGNSGRGSPGGTAVDELGQVPSRYVYLINHDGKQVSGGVRVSDGERMVRRESESGNVKDLQRENMRLLAEMAEMREEMTRLKETVVGLQMTQQVLISNHNAHTALLEQHRQALTTITSQPPTPCDRGTPSGEDPMYRLSMPPSHFSSSPAPLDSMTDFPNPPFPSPRFPFHSLSELATPRTSRMFNECIHPSMLEMNKLNISSSPTYEHRYHVTPDIVMAENFLVSGPSDVVQPGVEEEKLMRKRVFNLEAATGGMSENGGSGLAQASQMVKKDNNRPGMGIPRRIQSPASQTEVSEAEPGESSAMAIDGGYDGSDEPQLQPGRLWNPII
jgi:hypothetical protein